MVLSIALFISWPLFSSPIGNPALPSLLEQGFFIPDKCWSNPQLGFIGDYLIQKRFRTCHASQAIGLRKAEIGGISETGTAVWSIRERFNFQVEAGTGQFEWRWRQVGRNVSGRSQGGVVWSMDAKLMVLEIKDTMFAFDAHAGGWDGMEGPASSDGEALPGKSKSHLRFWQIGGAVTQKISHFAPYLGFAVNRTRFKVSRLATGTAWMHARHDIGPFVGCSICNGLKFLVNVEWRGWFEEGLAVSGQVRF